MKVIEYGKKNSEVIVLLHGGGLSWWNYREVAELLQQEYHVIIPILDGHSASDKAFTSIEDNASEIIEYIDENYNGSVALIGGLSLGGQILVEILSQRNDICKVAIIESALVIPMKLTHYLVKPMIEMSYGLIQQGWFARLQFKSLRIKKELFDEYYRDTCNITKENMISFLRANSWYNVKESIVNSQARVYVFVG
ncbi:MAG: alpha/beta fold hydrolase, partial [Christensenellaceae bacterium]